MAYRNEDEQRGYDERQEAHRSGRFAHMPYDQSYDYERGWRAAARDIARERAREEERQQEEEAYQRRVEAEYAEYEYEQGGDDGS